MLCLKHERYHVPSTGNLVNAKLFPVPLLRVACRSSEVGPDEQQSGQDGPIRVASLRGRGDGDGDVEKTFVCIVWADNVGECALAGESVFLQGGQVSMACVLLPACKSVKCKPSNDPRGQEVECRGMDGIPAINDCTYQSGLVRSCTDATKGGTLLTGSLDPNGYVHSSVVAQPHDPEDGPHG